MSGVVYGFLVLGGVLYALCDHRWFDFVSLVAQVGQVVIFPNIRMGVIVPRPNVSMLTAVMGEVFSMPIFLCMLVPVVFGLMMNLSRIMKRP
jgi:hypothetical protein